MVSRHRELGLTDHAVATIAQDHRTENGGLWLGSVHGKGKLCPVCGELDSGLTWTMMTGRLTHHRRWRPGQGGIWSPRLRYRAHRRNTWTIPALMLCPGPWQRRLVGAGWSRSLPVAYSVWWGSRRCEAGWRPRPAAAIATAAAMMSVPATARAWNAPETGIAVAVSGAIGAISVSSAPRRRGGRPAAHPESPLAPWSRTRSGPAAWRHVAVVVS
jgi:hypothetical protein